MVWFFCTVIFNFGHKRDSKKAFESSRHPPNILLSAQCGAHTQRRKDVRQGCVRGCSQLLKISSCASLVMLCTFWCRRLRICGGIVGQPASRGRWSRVSPRCFPSPATELPALSLPALPSLCRWQGCVLGFPRLALAIEPIFTLALAPLQLNARARVPASRKRASLRPPHHFRSPHPTPLSCSRWQGRRWQGCVFVGGITHMKNEKMASRTMPPPPLCSFSQAARAARRPRLRRRPSRARRRLAFSFPLAGA